MKQSSKTKKFNNFFPLNEVVLGEKDRRTKVSDKQLITFPFNAIGWIKSKQKYSSNKAFPEEARGTGFLIS